MYLILIFLLFFATYYKEYISFSFIVFLLQFKQGKIIFNSYKLSSILTHQLKQLISLRAKIIRVSNVSHPKLNRVILLGAGMTLSIGYQYVIEDEAIKNIRSLMNMYINTLRSQYGQTTIYPQIKYQLMGNTYEIIFQIDQRKCDLFTLISTFMNVYQTDKSFRVTDMKVFTNSTNNLTTFQVDFQQNDAKFKTDNSKQLDLKEARDKHDPKTASAITQNTKANVVRLDKNKLLPKSIASKKF